MSEVVAGPASDEGASSKPRLLVVDDEEAILETMTFTFMDEYEVLTSTDAGRALDLLEANQPVAVVISDQRMPGMTGSEFLAEVYRRHPETSRIILTGFADMDSAVEAINAGHVYAYVNKPWEPDELKQVVRRACEHFALKQENHRLLEDLKASNLFLEAVIDRLDTGAIAVDASGTVRAANHAAREYLGLGSAPCGCPLSSLLDAEKLRSIAQTIDRLAEAGGGRFEDAEIRVGQTATRVRISLDSLEDGDGNPIGRVILFKEVSHEPLRRRFEELVAELAHREGALRDRLEQALVELRALVEEVQATGISSPGMAELVERASRVQTAIQNWLDVDDLMAREDYPDAQSLVDRMRVAAQRWPLGEPVPERVQQLERQVEAYYESGENPKQRVL